MGDLPIKAPDEEELVVGTEKNDIPDDAEDAEEDEVDDEEADVDDKYAEETDAVEFRSKSADDDADDAVSEAAISNPCVAS